MIGKEISSFKMWCQKVLPLVYDDSLSYYECLCKVTTFLNEVIEQINELTTVEEEFQNNLTQVWEQYKEFIDKYFENLDVQDEINKKLDTMASDGTLSALIQPLFDVYKAQINGTVIEQNEKIETLKSRMDTFTRLSEGSTTGDAELIDIRNGAFGEVFSTAGESVRKQIVRISEETINVWKGESTLNFTTSTTIYLDDYIPAGDYTLSANITTDITSSGNSRVYFYKDEIATASLGANPYLPHDKGRNYVNFTLTQDANVVKFYAGASASAQEGHLAEWRDIMITKGSDVYDYVPNITGNDCVARNFINNFNGQYNADNFPVGEIVGERVIEVSVKPKSNRHPATLCIDAKYTSTNGSVPTVRSYITTDRNLTRGTTEYVIGSDKYFALNKYRGVPYIWDNRDVVFRISVPSGCTLNIRHIYVEYDTPIVRTVEGVQFNGHDGCCNIAPSESLASFRMAYESGYNNCVIIPKVTSDGVWFAYHDDTFDIATTQLRNSDGSVITDTTYNGKYFHEIPWSYLKNLDAGRLYGKTFYNTPLMTLDEFFSFCAKTGIRPVFSMHPRIYIQSSSRLRALRKLVEKYNLLNKLIIKVPLTTEDETPNIYNLNNLRAIFNVFGNSIYKYEVDAVRTMDNPYETITLLQAFDDITVPKTVEWWVTQLLTDESTGIALVNATLDAGFGVSCASYEHITESGTSHHYTSGYEINKLLSWGVTEFTDDYNTSNGLYW